MRNFQKKFEHLAYNWKRDTGGYSTLLHITSDKNYLKIIEMGSDVIPLILEDIKKCSSIGWFWALKELSNENPVAIEDIGNTQKMQKAWIKWGIEKKLIK